MPRPGVTLVELLVVVAVLGMLAGLLIPAVQASRESARIAQCASNMRQVGLAMLQFSDLHHGRWPETTHTATPDPVTGKHLRAWIYTLAKHLEDVDAVRICPSDRAGDLRLKGKGTSYSLNGWLSREARPPFDNLRKVTSTSKSVVAFELAEEKDAGALRSMNPADVDPYNDHVHSFNWFRASNVAQGLVFKAIRAEVAVDRHAGTTHFLYADGHVELVTQEQIEQWAVEPFDFSRPPD